MADVANATDQRGLLGPNGYPLVAYGPDANCTLELCHIEATVYNYRPSLPTSALFIAIYGMIGIVQAAQMLRYKTWWFGGSMVLGCIMEILGYGGRILYYQNPFSFSGFLLQIICIASAPVFYTAAIYFTLSKIVVILDKRYSRFPPKYFYYIFIASDVIALSLQAGGGATSSQSAGKSKIGVDIALAGLSIQVISLCFFIYLVIDYLVRYCRGTGTGIKNLTRSGKIFAIFLTAAILLILARCSYRIAELHEGYTGDIIHNEPLFIALEGVVIIIAAICLCIAHPGPVFGQAGDLSGNAKPNTRMGKIEKPEEAVSSSGESLGNTKTNDNTVVTERL